MLPTFWPPTSCAISLDFRGNPPSRRPMISEGHPTSYGLYFFPTLQEIGKGGQESRALVRKHKTWRVRHEARFQKRLWCTSSSAKASDASDVTDHSAQRRISCARLPDDHDMMCRNRIRVHTKGVGHATPRFLEEFLEASLTAIGGRLMVRASWLAQEKAKKQQKQRKTAKNCKKKQRKTALPKLWNFLGKSEKPAKKQQKTACSFLRVPVAVCH